MTDSFISILVLVAVQRYLGLGNWVWWVFGVAMLLDLAGEIMKQRTQ